MTKLQSSALKKVRVFFWGGDETGGGLEQKKPMGLFQNPQKTSIFDTFLGDEKPFDLKHFFDL